MIPLNSKIFIAGHKGLVGGAILRTLKKKGYKNILTVTKKKLDLTNKKKVLLFLMSVPKKKLFLYQLKKI